MHDQAFVLGEDPESHDRLYGEEPPLSEAQVLEIAAALGLDMRHALATDHPQVPAPVEAPGKGVDERGLADAGLAGDEQNLPLAAPGARQAAVHNLQLRLAADAERCSRGERSRRAAIPFMTGPGDQFDVADQAIAALPDGLDVARGRRRVAEERAQLPHALLRPVLATMSARR